MQLKKDFKLGDIVTEKTINRDGDATYVSGEISSISGDNIFITKKFPRTEHFSVKREDIVNKGE